jgi:GntR family transcriptional regulator
MLFPIRVDPRDAMPLWKQIEETIRRLVALKNLLPGSAIPSVRELARQLRINPATVSRAYQHLTDAGVLEVKRGEGTFVADSPPAFERSERARLLLEGARRYVNLAVMIGATEGEAVGELHIAWCGSCRTAQGGGK